MAMAPRGWSSLPADLVNRVADCLLASNDLDCYKDLRAVCQHWRSSTADPVRNQHEPRFRPSRWIMLDGHKASSDIATLMFVNTATARFVQRRLPCLHDRDCHHVFVTSTTDGLLVLAGRDPPFAVIVLNPFTGSLISFAAPLPTLVQTSLTADVVGSSPTLVLVSISRGWVYLAEPQSKSFSVVKSHRDCPASRLPLIAAVINRESIPGAKNIFDQLWSEVEEDCRCYAVVAGVGGDMLAVLKRRRGMDVFKIDAAGNAKRSTASGAKLASLASGALLLTPIASRRLRPTVLTSNLLATIFTKASVTSTSSPLEIVTTKNQRSFRELWAAFTSRVLFFTLTQFLSDYTMDIPCHQLALEMSSTHIKPEHFVEDDCYEVYIDLLSDDESNEDYSDDDDYGYQDFSGYDDYGYQGW